MDMSKSWIMMNYAQSLLPVTAHMTDTQTDPFDP